MKNLSIVLIAYLLLACGLFTIAYIKDKRDQEQTINNISEFTEQGILKVEYKPSPTPTNSPTPTPTSTPTPTPTPTPICEISNQQFYNECVSRGLVTPAQEDHISTDCGVFYGESGRETYYNLKMDLCVYYMRELGYDEYTYPYWIRDDGAKMLGIYVMVAANWKIRPKGTLVETSLGTGIVVDTGEFVADYPNGIDIAVDW